MLCVSKLTKCGSRIYRYSPLIGAICVFFLVLGSCRGLDKPTVVPIIDVSGQPPEDPRGVDLVKLLAKLIHELADNNNFNGIIHLSKNDKVLLHRIYGVANRDTGERITLHTKFNLASASKMFTTVLITRLVESGQLRFDNPIGKFLDTSWISEEVGRTVLVSHLLSYTSGMGLYWDEFEKWNRRDDPGFHGLQENDSSKVSENKSRSGSYPGRRSERKPGVVHTLPTGHLWPVPILCQLLDKTAKTKQNQLQTNKKRKLIIRFMLGRYFAKTQQVTNIAVGESQPLRCQKAASGCRIDHLAFSSE